MIEFKIPGELPSTNEIIEESKRHPIQYSKMKKIYTELVAYTVMRLPKIKSADFKVVWHCPNRRKDKDNIMGGQKFIFDGLVMAGVIKNDGWSQVGDVSHQFEVNKADPHVEVVLLNVEY